MGASAFVPFCQTISKFQARNQKEVHARSRSNRGPLSTAIFPSRGRASSAGIWNRLQRLGTLEHFPASERYSHSVPDCTVIDTGHDCHGGNLRRLHGVHRNGIVDDFAKAIDSGRRGRSSDVIRIHRSAVDDCPGPARSRRTSRTSPELAE